MHLDFARNLPRQLAALSLTALMTFPASPASAQTPQPRPERGYVELLDGSIWEGRTSETYSADVVATFRRDLGADNAFTARTLRRMQQTVEASSRARAGEELLRYDLNGDLRVTLAEWRAQQPEAAFQFSYFDADGDGVIAFTEAMAMATAGSARNISRIGQDFLDLAKIRAPLTPDAMQIEAAATFRAADTDGDDRISAAEARSWRAAHPTRENEWSPDMGCLLRKPRDDDMIVLITDFERDSYLPGRDVAVHLQQGWRSVYLLLMSTNPRRWNLDGETRRVTRVNTFMNGMSEMAVSGIAERYVRTFGGSCQFNSHWWMRSMPGVKDSLAKLLGRPADMIIDANGKTEVLVGRPKRKGALAKAAGPEL